MTEAARRTRRLACLHPFASYESDLSPDLALFRRVCECVPTAGMEDRTQILTGMRAVKSAAELALIEQAVAATVRATRPPSSTVRPDADEGQVAEAMTAAFRLQGGEPAFEPIVGSGLNGTVLHYSANDDRIEQDDLVVIDYAAAVGGYASDVTRTLPAGGRFTSEQRELYESCWRPIWPLPMRPVPAPPSPRCTRRRARSSPRQATRTTSCTASDIIWAWTFTTRRPTGRS